MWRLHQHPEAQFDEQELAALGQGVFAGLRAAGVVEPLPLDLAHFARTTSDGRLLEAVDDGESVELIDPEEVEFEPIPLDVTRSRPWRVSAERMAGLLQEVNGLSGTSGIVAERMLLLGRRDDGQSVVLALFTSWPQAREPIAALHAKLATNLLVSSMCRPPLLKERMELRSRGIQFSGLRDDGQLRLDDDAPVRRERQQRAGRPRGRGVASLLDCWIECHGLARDFLTPQSFYEAVHEYLLRNPREGISSVPSKGNFSRLRHNGKVTREKAGHCIWHRCASPPDPSHLVSY